MLQKMINFIGYYKFVGLPHIRFIGIFYIKIMKPAATMKGGRTVVGGRAVLLQLGR